MASDLEGHHEPGTATNETAKATEPAEPNPARDAETPAPATEPERETAGREANASRNGAAAPNPSREEEAPAGEPTPAAETWSAIAPESGAALGEASHRAVGFVEGPGAESRAAFGAVSHRVAGSAESPDAQAGGTPGEAFHRVAGFAEGPDVESGAAFGEAFHRAVGSAEGPDVESDAAFGAVSHRAVGFAEGPGAESGAAFGAVSHRDAVGSAEGPDVQAGGTPGEAFRRVAGFAEGPDAESGATPSEAFHRAVGSAESPDAQAGATPGKAFHRVAGSVEGPDAESGAALGAASDRDAADSAAGPDAESGDEPISSEATIVDDLATEVGAIAAPDAEPAHVDADGRPPVPPLTKFWALTVLALGPVLTGYIAIAALLALVTGVASNARFTTTGVLNAALPSWLAAHQVPVEIFGLELGILPLLPTVGVAVLTAKAAARAVGRLELRRPGQAGLVIGVAASAHAMAGLVVAALVVDAEVSADPLAALYHPALVAALAATVGVARPCGLLTAIAQRADAAAVAGLRVGLLAVVLLLTAGGAVLTFGLLTSIATARDLFPMGAGNAVGMLLLSIGYLPNAVVAATSFIAGPGFSLGTVTVAPLEFHGGGVPGVPLLAAMPEAQAAWWPALFVVPLGVGVVVGRRLRHVDDNPVVRLRAVAVATGVVAVCFVVLAGTAGGRLGRGTFDPVSMRAAALSIALVLWTVVPGAIAAWFGGPRPAAEPMPGLIDDTPEEEPEDEPMDEPELPGPRDAVEESGEVARD